MKLFNIRLAYAMGALALIMGSVNVSAKPTPKVQTSKKGAPKAKVVKPAASTTGATAAATTIPAAPVATGPKVTIKNNLSDRSVIVTLGTEKAPIFGAGATTIKNTNNPFTEIKPGETKPISLTSTLTGIMVQLAPVADCKNAESLCNYSSGKNESACNKQQQCSMTESILSDIFYDQDTSWSIDPDSEYPTYARINSR